MENEKIQELMMKVVDGVASPEEETSLADAIKGSERYEGELRAFKKIKEVTTRMQFKELPDSYWTGYWQDVYRRTERAFAWIAMSIGLMVVLGFLAYTGLSRFYSDPDVSMVDRVAGAALSAVRILLIAVLIVMIFDRIIPADREPNFLVDSRLRPYLSEAGRRGLQSLPPELADQIDRIKHEHGL